jgi:hypothetical protein
VADDTVQLWAGSPAHLECIADLAAPVPTGGLVGLVRFRGEWHLFARSELGRSSHLVSTDLCNWTHLPQLVSSFPAFAVSGAVVRGGELLLAGRVFDDDTAFGWGLLRSDGRNFEARPVPLPLATQLGVIGPIVGPAGEAVLLLDSGHNRTVATSSGGGWSLSLLVPPVQPLAVFSDGRDVWLAGADVETGVASVARLFDDQVVALPGPELGRVRSAIACGDRIVLARET